MNKRIKKWGDSLVIVFTKEDIDLYGLVEGDVVGLEEMVIQKKIKESKK